MAKAAAGNASLFMCLPSRCTSTAPMLAGPPMSFHSAKKTSDLSVGAGKSISRSGLSFKRLMPLVTVRAEKTVGFSSELSTDLPLYEPPKVPFEQYLSDRQRVFQAIFPDERRSEKLNDEEWRIHMLPIQFLFLTAYPVIDMSIVVQSPGQGYPQGISKNVPKVLTFEAKRWDLQGLDYVLKPSDFVLGVRGALYSEKRGARSRLKAQMDINVEFVMPPALLLVPEDILKNVGSAVLLRLLETMKERVNERILSDYRAYTMEQRNADHVWRTSQAIKPAL